MDRERRYELFVDRSDPGTASSPEEGTLPVHRVVLLSVEDESEAVEDRVLGSSAASRNEYEIFFFLMGDGLLKVQRMGTSPFHSPKVSAHKKLSAVV